jgi:steroid 5-alpha reductase family enzyme
MTFFYFCQMNKQISLNRPASIWLSIFIYLLAIAAAILVARLFSGYHPLVMIAAGDLAATILVFVFSVLLNNSSAYDPYWSVKPIVIAVAYPFFFDLQSLDLRQWLVLAGVALYAVRLTTNFYRDWPGFIHEDWRYVNFRKSSGKAYWLVSFLAIHLFPTIMTYLGCLALFPLFDGEGKPFLLMDVIAAIVLYGSVIYAFIADEQLRTFRMKPGNKGKTITTGLWRLSRHPNYLGEISTWWGLALFAYAAAFENWWTFAGPVAITLMFLFASIPLIEKRNLERRKNYREYLSKVPMLLPAKFLKNR